MAARVEADTEDSNNFRNLVTVLAEERIGPAANAPMAFTKGAFRNSED
jgi:hypothetical protein